MRPMSHPGHYVLKLFLASFLWSGLTGATSSPACYFPDGTAATGFTSCNAGAAFASCCYTGDACLSNGYCLQQGSKANRISRGACTDPSFMSSSCPGPCRDVVRNLPVSLYLAFDTDNGDFCCQYAYNITSNQCQTTTNGSTLPFALPPGAVIIDRSNGMTLPVNYTNSTSLNVATVTASVQGKADSSPDVAVVAAAIAIPLGVLLIAALAACGILWSSLKKVKARLAQSAAPRDMMHQYQQVPTYPSMSQVMPAEMPGQHAFAEAPGEGIVWLADSRSIPKR